MGLGGILQELKTEGVLALYHDYRSGRCNDLSGNGNNGTPSSGALWSKRNLWLSAVTDEITVTDAASLRIGTGTLYVSGTFVSQVSNEALLGRSNAANPLLWFYMDSTPSVKLYDGTSVRSLGVNIVGKRSIAASWTSGNTPVGYLDGVSAGSFSGAFTPLTGAGTVLEIGNILNNNRNRSRIETAVIISRVLTATEHARLYGQLEGMRWNTKGLTPGPMIP